MNSEPLMKQKLQLDKKTKGKKSKVKTLTVNQKEMNSPLAKTNKLKTSCNFII